MMKVQFNIVLFLIILWKVFTFVNIAQVQSQGLWQIPNTAGLGNVSFRQIQLTQERIFGLTTKNVFISWLKNGTEFLINRQIQTIEEELKISYFTITANQQSIIFCDLYTQKIHILSTLNLSTFAKIITNRTTLSAVAKTGSKYIVSYSINNEFQFLCFMEYYSQVSARWSSGINLAISGSIRIKINKQQNYAVIWNQGGKYCLLKVDIAVPIIIYCRIRPNLTLNTPSDIAFSPDGSRLILQFDDLQNLTVFNLAIDGVVLIKSVAMPFQIYKVQFLDQNTSIALFHGTNVTFYHAESMELAYSLNLNSQSSPYLKVDQSNAKIYSPKVNQIRFYNFICHLGYQMMPSSSICFNTNPLAQIQALTIQSDTQSESLNQIQNQTIQSFSQQFNSLALQNGPLMFLNKIPGSRNIFRPIFMFFGNFDDLWLYNYINITYDTSVQDTFDSIQKLEEDKWQTIPVKTIWQNWFGFNITQRQEYLNNTLRLAYSSQKYIRISQRANGYVLNTFDFFLSNFILILGFHFIGKVMYCWLKKMNFRAKCFFLQNDFTLSLVIVSLEGNIQFMSYLMGFEILNLWHSDFSFKIYGCLMVICFFLLAITATTIYLFLKYFYKSRAKIFFQSYKYRITSIIYMSISNGVRSVCLGLLQFTLPQSSSYILQKFLALLFVECIYLVMNIYLINLRKKFFIKQGRQWIILWVSFLRIILIAVFSVTETFIENKDEFPFVSEISNCILTVYTSFWILSIFYEGYFQMIEIKSTLMLEKQSVRKDNQQKLSKKKQNSLQNIFRVEQAQNKLSVVPQKRKKELVRLSAIGKTVFHNIKVQQNLYPNSKLPSITEEQTLEQKDTYRHNKIRIKRKMVKQFYNETIIQASSNFKPISDVKVLLYPRFNDDVKRQKTTKEN